MTIRRACACITLFLLLGLAACRHGGATAEGTDAIITHKPLEVPFDYVADAAVAEEVLFGHPAKTLLIRFTHPQTVLSSLSG
jgi:hypothetical protein